MFSWNWRDFMTNVLGCAFLLDFTFENQEIAETQWTIFFLSLYFKIRKFIFRQSESCVLTMSSWSRRVKIRGLKSSVEVQQPTVSESEENVIFLLVYQFRELLLRFNGENRQKRQCCDHRSLFPSPSRITSRLLGRLECVAWRIVASHCALKGQWCRKGFFVMTSSCLASSQTEFS